MFLKVFLTLVSGFALIGNVDAQGGGQSGTTECLAGGVGATSCSVNADGRSCSVSCSSGYFACCTIGGGCYCCKNPDGHRQPRVVDGNSNVLEDIQGVHGTIALSKTQGGAYTIVSLGKGNHPLEYVFVIQNASNDKKFLDLPPITGRLLFSNKSVKLVAEDGATFLFTISERPNRELAEDASVVVHALGIARYFSIEGKPFPDNHQEMVRILEPTLASRCVKPGSSAVGGL